MEVVNGNHDVLGNSEEKKTKASKIREALDVLGWDAKTKDVVEYLNKQNVEVLASHIYQERGKREKKSEFESLKLAKLYLRQYENDFNDAVFALDLANKFIEDLGGYEYAKQALQVLKDLTE
jgi:hypothetical protein